MILSLDLSSSKTGWAVYDQLSGTFKEVGVFCYKANHEFLFHQFHRDLASVLSNYDITTIIIEDCYLGVNPKTYKILCNLQGVALQSAESYTDDDGNHSPIPVIMLHSSEWRKMVGIRYGVKMNYRKREDCKLASLELANKVLNKNNNEKIISNDISDAICLALSI